MTAATLSVPRVWHMLKGTGKHITAKLISPLNLYNDGQLAVNSAIKAFALASCV